MLLRERFAGVSAMQHRKTGTPGNAYETPAGKKKNRCFGRFYWYCCSSVLLRQAAPTLPKRHNTPDSEIEVSKSAGSGETRLGILSCGVSSSKRKREAAAHTRRSFPPFHGEIRVFWETRLPLIPINGYCLLSTPVVIQHAAPPPPRGSRRTAFVPRKHATFLNFCG